MTPKITGQRFRELAEAKGGKPLPPDHPIYSEPPSIIFLNRGSKQSEKKDINSPQKDLASNSDSKGEGQNPPPVCGSGEKEG